MSEALNLKCPYKVFRDAQLAVYSFITENGIEYRISFIGADYLFKGTAGEGIIHNVFSLLIENITGSQPPQDLKVKETITAILAYFFENPDNSIIYLCDSSDKRELARFRKFNAWFLTAEAHPDLEKLDETFLVEDGAAHYTTMICHKGNSHYALLRQSYFEIVESLKK